MSVYEAVDAELIQLRVTPVAPGIAAVALALAAQLDSAHNATSAANVGRELRQVMETLRSLAPVDGADDVVTDLAKERETRRGTA